MSVIKQCFRSRYPIDGRLLEVDFSQLEIVGVAILSGDKALKSDIISGRDMHTVRAAELFGKAEADVTKAERKIAKALSFQLQYGAGAASMAAKNKIPKKLAEDFIELYYARYPTLKQWQEDNIEAVNASRKPSPYRTERGEPAGVGVLESPTGRIYSFTEYDAPEFMREDKKWRKGVSTSFSPTQIKNYPSQGFATGDVMALYRANLLQCFREGLYAALPIMTIHDSVMFDCQDKYSAARVFDVCKAQASVLATEIESRWGIRCDLPFKVEAKCGPTWAEMVDFKI
jgi:DNA polymerase I-like protein with 3'-5' exonuclease and polymerase domains